MGRTCTGNEAPGVNRGVWRPRSRQNVLVSPSRVGQHPLVGCALWPAFHGHPLKTHAGGRRRRRMCSPFPPW